MAIQQISSPTGWAELDAQAGTLMVSSATESVTVMGRADADEIGLTLIYNERELFRGGTSELESKLEKLEAVGRLLQNPAFVDAIYACPDLKANPDVRALLYLPASGGAVSSSPGSPAANPSTMPTALPI